MVYTFGFVLLILFGTTFCRPQDQQPPGPGPSTTPVSIVSQTESIDPNGNFNFSYETSNGIRVEEAGVLRHVTGLRARANFAADDSTPDEDDILVQTGSFSYTAPDGTVISLRYIADENGFQPVGDHLPTAPPVPADILRSLNQTELQPQPQPQLQQQQPQQLPQQPQEHPGVPAPPPPQTLPAQTVPPN